MQACTQACGRCVRVGSSCDTSATLGCVHNQPVHCTHSPSQLGHERLYLVDAQAEAPGQGDVHWNIHGPAWTQHNREEEEERGGVHGWGHGVQGKSEGILGWWW